jgi:hypothetical protein
MWQRCMSLRLRRRLYSHMEHNGQRRRHHSLQRQSDADVHVRQFMAGRQGDKQSLNRQVLFRIYAVK